MKIIYPLLLLGASLTASGQPEPSTQSVATNPPFKLEITANLKEGHSDVWDFTNSAQTTVTAGSIVVFAIRKTNISDHEINKSTCTGAHSNYYIEIRDSNGNLVGPKHSNEVEIQGGACRTCARYER